MKHVAPGRGRRTTRARPLSIPNTVFFRSGPRRELYASFSDAISIPNRSVAWSMEGERRRCMQRRNPREAGPTRDRRESRMAGQRIDRSRSRRRSLRRRSRGISAASDETCRREAPHRAVRPGGSARGQCRSTPRQCPREWPAKRVRTTALVREPIRRFRPRQAHRRHRHLVRTGQRYFRTKG